MLLLAASPAVAGTLDRARHDGILRCGAEPRAGVAEDAGDGTLAGRAVALCRSVAISVIGQQARVAFRLYEPGQPTPADDVAFLPADAVGSDRVAVALASTVRLALLVPPASSAHAPADLAQKPICFLTGSDAQAALDAAAASWPGHFLHMAYQEEDEMADAFAAHRCAAVAGETQELARFGAGRILQPPLGQFAIVATTPAADPAWASVVRAALHAQR